MKNILILGGSGFVGSAIARRLVAAGCRVTIPTRAAHPPQPVAGAIYRQADIHDDSTLGELVAGQSVVINLVGILKGNFAQAHTHLPRRVAEALCALPTTEGLPPVRLVHMSALGADPGAPSAYLRSKGEGEKALQQVLATAARHPPVPRLTIFRPSVIFGRGDSFLTLFAGLLKMAPFVPLACPDARFQPVWVEDVAAAFCHAALADDQDREPDGSFDLGGPNEYTLRALVSYTGKISGHRRPILGLGAGLSYLQAWAMEWIPGGPMTRDNVASMKIPSVCPAGTRFPFHITPTALEEIAPGYLSQEARKKS